jgi:hypothetical protein
VFIAQLHKIYKCSSKKEMVKPSVCIVNILSPNINKKSKIELSEDAKKRKQIKRQTTREKYANEEYKKMRVEQLVKNK